VLALAAAPVAAAEPPVDAGVAALYVGRERTVEGVVTAAERDGYVVRLTLGEPPGSLRVQLLLGMLSRFPDEPETYYLGKKVRVYGRIGEFRGQAEIILREPDRILVVDDEAPAADPEVGILEDRVRELEERLRTLEGGEPKPAAPEAP
jgi:DNA/RNA endonuclease YhcR with UshA esterase domain